MASDYEGFPVWIRDAAGVLVRVPAGVEVAVYDTVAEADIAESPLFTDSNGEIASGTFAAVTAGTKVLFRVENHEGRAASVAQVTT